MPLLFIITANESLGKKVIEASWHICGSDSETHICPKQWLHHKDMNIGLKTVKLQQHPVGQTMLIQRDVFLVRILQ